MINIILHIHRISFDISNTIFIVYSLDFSCEYNFHIRVKIIEIPLQIDVSLKERVKKL